MVTNTLTDTESDLGDTVATYVFDTRLAHTLLIWSGLALAGCLAGLVIVIGTAGSGMATAVIAPILLIGVALVAAWGVLLATTRLRRKSDRFVVRKSGLAHHHDGLVTRTRWVDIALVTHSGSQTGSRMARWNGGDYRCRVEVRGAGTRMFDNYVVDAVSLGREIESRSLA